MVTDRVIVGAHDVDPADPMFGRVEAAVAFASGGFDVAKGTAP
jgi:hypothetical protein